MSIATFRLGCSRARGCFIVDFGALIEKLHSDIPSRLRRFASGIVASRLRPCCNDDDDDDDDGGDDSDGDADGNADGRWR